MDNSPKDKILIVDDEKNNILALAQILQPLYELHIAKNGKAAIEVAKENNPDLILLDVVMPNMTGFDVLVELKNDDRTRNTPVIFITGLDSVEDEERGFRLGAVDYIKKPFNSTIVKARIKTHLQTMKQIRTIERLSMMDVLTNIPNRRSFENKVKEEWERAMCENKPIGILMIDVDYFKRYNDTYGHPQGDVLLQAITEVFNRSLMQGGDYVARWGGEEFMALLPNMDRKGVVEVAERLRLNVEKLKIPCFDGTDTSITVSIGVNSEIPSRGGSIAEFISKVDQALYHAKKSGKNKVCSYECVWGENELE